MSKKGSRKQYCKRGHDTFVTGRADHGGCIVCRREYYIPTKFDPKKRICPKGHDKDIVGRTADGRCKLCVSNYHKKVAPSRAVNRRAFCLAKYYKISIADYNNFLLNQDNVCIGCLRSPSEFKKAFAVDHDHRCCPGKETCGKCIRGLLCINCNVALGKLLDSPEILRRLANYIERKGK